MFHEFLKQVQLIQYLGHTYTKKAFLVHLIFFFNWVMCIVSGNPCPPNYHH